MKYPEGDPRNNRAMIPVFESIHEFTWHETDFRVWREEKDFDEAAKSNAEDIIAALNKADPMTLQGAAAVLHICERVNAFQITVKNGSKGVVVYTDWP